MDPQADRICCTELVIDTSGIPLYQGPTQLLESRAGCVAVASEDRRRTKRKTTDPRSPGQVTNTRLQLKRLTFQSSH